MIVSLFYKESFVKIIYPTEREVSWPRNFLTVPSRLDLDLHQFTSCKQEGSCRETTGSQRPAFNGDFYPGKWYEWIQSLESWWFQKRWTLDWNMAFVCWKLDTKNTLPETNMWQGRLGPSHQAFPKTEGLVSQRNQLSLAMLVSRGRSTSKTYFVAVGCCNLKRQLNQSTLGFSIVLIRKFQPAILSIHSKFQGFSERFMWFDFNHEKAHSFHGHRVCWHSACFSTLLKYTDVTFWI